MKKDIFTIISVTSSHVKMIQSRSGRVFKVEAKALHSFSDDALRGALTNFSLARNVFHDNLIFLLPRSAVIFKNLELPSRSSAEIRKMIPLQLVKELPYLLEDIIYDYQIAGQTASGYTKIFIVVAQKTIVEKYVKIFEQIGIAVSHFSVSTFGLWGWWQTRSSGRDIKQKGTLLVNVDVDGTELCLCTKESIFLTRILPTNIQDVAGEKYFDLIGQIALTLETYQRGGLGPAIEEIKVLMNCKEGDVFRDKLQDRCLVPVEIIDPLEGLIVSPKVNSAVFLKEEHGSIVSEAGFLLKNTARHVNLTPMEVFRKRQFQRQTRELVQMGIIFVLLILVGLFFAGSKIYYQRKNLDLVIAKQKEVEPFLTEKSNKEMFIAAIEQKLQDRVIMPDVLLELYQLTPEDVSLKSIAVDPKRSVSIQGYAQGDRSVNIFQKKLVNSQMFTEVTLQFATKRRIYNVELRDFKISAVIRAQRIDRLKEDGGDGF